MPINITYENLQLVWDFLCNGQPIGRKEPRVLPYGIIRRPGVMIVGNTQQPISDVVTRVPYDCSDHDFVVTKGCGDLHPRRLGAPPWANQRTSPTRRPRVATPDTVALTHTRCDTGATRHSIRHYEIFTRPYNATWFISLLLSSFDYNCAAQFRMWKAYY